MAFESVDARAFTRTPGAEGTRTENGKEVHTAAGFEFEERGDQQRVDLYSAGGMPKLCLRFLKCKCPYQLDCAFFHPTRRMWRGGRGVATAESVEVNSPAPAASGTRSAETAAAKSTRREAAQAGGPPVEDRYHGMLKSMTSVPKSTRAAPKRKAPEAAYEHPGKQSYLELPAHWNHWADESATPRGTPRNAAQERRPGPRQGGRR